MSTGPSESAIQRAILDWLAWHNVTAWRTNSGAIVTQNGRMVQLAPPGTADIIGIMPDGSGRLLAIEVKTRKGKQTQEQADFEQRVTTQGGVYILARSVDDVENGLAKAERMEK